MPRKSPGRRAAAAVPDLRHAGSHLADQPDAGAAAW